MFDKIIKKFIDLTSLIEIDEDGTEHKVPWTLREFLLGHLIIYLCLLTVTIVKYLIF